MASIIIWIDSTLQDLSNDTKNTKFGVQTKNLCKLQSMKHRIWSPNKEVMQVGIHEVVYP